MKHLLSILLLGIFLHPNTATTNDIRLLIEQINKRFKDIPRPPTSR